MQVEFLSISKSQKVCSQHYASKMSGHVSRLANKRETQLPNATGRVCGFFWLLDTQTTFEDSSPDLPTTIKEPCVPNGKSPQPHIQKLPPVQPPLFNLPLKLQSSVLLFKPHKPAADDHASAYLSVLGPVI